MISTHRIPGSCPFSAALLLLFAGCHPAARGSHKRPEARQPRTSFPPLTQQASLTLTKEHSIDIRLLEINVPKDAAQHVIEKGYRARYEWSMTIYCGADSSREARVIAERAPGMLSSWRVPWPEDCDHNKNEVRLTIEANYLRCANPNIVYTASNYAPGMMLQVDMICKEPLPFGGH